MNRRTFLRQAGALALGGAGLAALPFPASTTPMPDDAPLFDISLAQWSLHRSIFGETREWPYERFLQVLHSDPQQLYQGTLDPLDFPAHARQAFGIDAVEYISTFYFGRARDEAFLQQLKRRADDAGVRSLLIMVDNEGALDAPNAAARAAAVGKHLKWIEAAAFLGGHAIRVNAGNDFALGMDAYDEVQKRAADGLHRLGTAAEDTGIHVLVENHGSLSSHGQWVAETVAQADHPLVGTLPDFGNFCVEHEGAPWDSPCANAYDRYEGVREMMPAAEAVSAKSYAFDDDGNETATDFRRMMKIVLDAGYRGPVGIEYEGGDAASEAEGIRATKALLERVRDELAPAYAEKS